MEKVFFLYHAQNDDLFAYFPKNLENIYGYRTSYSHIGQHSSCHPAYAIESRIATFDEYKDLAEELYSIGYEFQILNESTKLTYKNVH